jgi:hypothetical protein
MEPIAAEIRAAQLARACVMQVNLEFFRTENGF